MYMKLIKEFQLSRFFFNTLLKMVSGNCWTMHSKKIVNIIFGWNLTNLDMIYLMFLKSMFAELLLFKSILYETLCKENNIYFRRH